MWSYLLKRLLLIVPTLLGIVLITFVVLQMVPGGPVERMIAQVRAHERGGGKRRGFRRWGGVDPAALHFGARAAGLP